MSHRTSIVHWVLRVLGFLAIAWLIAPALVGQEPPPESPPTGGDIVEIAPPQQAVIITGSSSSDGSGPRFTMFSTAPTGVLAPSIDPDISSLVNWPDVQQELALVDEQQQKLSEMQQRFAKRMQERLTEIHEGGDLLEGGMNPRRGEEIREMFEKFRAEQREELEQILLPHQLQRLEQISLQMDMKGRGDAEALAGDRLADALGLTDEQKQRLSERAKEINAELEKDIAKLREEAREELFGELTPSQREKLKSMLGDRFEMRSSPFPFSATTRRSGQEAPEAQTESAPRDKR
jgi:hypothetical protein